MLSSPLAEQVVRLLPTLKNTGQDSVYLGPCPFHMGALSSLVVDYSSESASCLSCGYGASFQTLVDDLNTETGATNPSPEQTGNPAINLPNFGKSYSYLLTEEVGLSIHNHLFKKKVRQLNSAVEQLARLVSKMKDWVDPSQER